MVERVEELIKRGEGEKSRKGNEEARGRRERAILFAG
jgi:hypothetical protein